MKNFIMTRLDLIMMVLILAATLGTTFKVLSELPSQKEIQTFIEKSH